LGGTIEYVGLHAFPKSDGGADMTSSGVFDSRKSATEKTGASDNEL